MKEKKYTLWGKTPPHLLEEAPTFNDFYERRKSRKKWNVIQRGFMAASVLLCMGIVCLAFFGTGSRWLSSQTVSKISEMIANVEFRDLSGETDEGDAHSKDSAFLELIEGILLPDHTLEPSKKDEVSTDSDTGDKESDSDQKAPLTLQALYAFDYDAVPDGETPIIPMDLSLSQFGNEYINNATGLDPDTKKLLTESFNSSVSVASAALSSDPLVLVVHTHGTEGYSKDGAISFLDQGEEFARSQDTQQNVVAVGKVLADALNENGINTIHCTIMHDQLQYKDAYARSEETIRRYLKEYPSIKLVIDLHRDSVLKSGGELVRPVTLADGEAAAQMMCVIGSSWNGGDYPNWEKNLALALQLRQKMNEAVPNICRPVYLKGSTYNQELAPYSILVEMGASGNSLEEAKRTAERFALVLVEIVPVL